MIVFERINTKTDLTDEEELLKNSLVNYLKYVGIVNEIDGKMHHSFLSAVDPSTTNKRVLDNNTNTWLSVDDTKKVDLNKIMANKLKSKPLHIPRGKVIFSFSMEGKKIKYNAPFVLISG